ncbi:MAG: DUF1800 domain-containing protein [Verrucomicrobiota bacterium]|nr:DUF1800 domain-containing protein [Verrucomicrobiota bacterium]
MPLFLIIALCASLAPICRAAEKADLSEKTRIVHALNRLGYGPRPGDVERVTQMGLEKYLQQQLHPETIDDSAAERIVAELDTLKLSSRELTMDYYAEIRRFVDKQRTSGNAQEMKARYGLDLGQVPPKPAPPSSSEKTPAQKWKEGLKELPSRISLRCLGELQTAKVVRAIESERQLQEVLVDFWSNHFNIDTKKGPCRVLKIADDRDVIRPHIFGKFRDLLGASAKSPAMLVYLDNIQNSKPRELGVFEQSIRQKTIEKLVGSNVMPAETKPKMDGGLNENYAREIMELHTLGVDGGYTQQDVQEVARCFTGWGWNPLEGTFAFGPRRHDDGEKKVLGHVIPANGGIADGEKVLDLLASHPSTAKFIATKLCRRLVADEPPPALVERAARTFRESEGDLRKVVETIITSPEFFSPPAIRAKLKSPFEFAVSAVRATGGHVATGNPPPVKVRSVLEGAATMGYGGELVSSSKKKSLNWCIYEMGQPLFAFQAPTGYPEDSRQWVSAGALISRLNFALALTGGSVADASVEPRDLIQGADTDRPGEVLDCVLQKLLNGEASAATRETLLKNMTSAEGPGATVNVSQVIALVLGSPEFQRH